MANKMKKIKMEINKNKKIELLITPSDKKNQRILN